MSYILNATTIRAPQNMNESNSTQYAQNRVLSGAVARDMFGSNKRVWALIYRNITKAEYDTIKAIHNTYLSTGNEVSWQVTETNYAVSATTVHVDIPERAFETGGETYLSNFTLVLTEA